MICSITSSGLAMPPDQNAFQTLSILFRNSPGSIVPRAFRFLVGPYPTGRNSESGWRDLRSPMCAIYEAWLHLG